MRTCGPLGWRVIPYTKTAKCEAYGRPEKNFLVLRRHFRGQGCECLQGTVRAA